MKSNVGTAQAHGDVSFSKPVLREGDGRNARQRKSKSSHTRCPKEHTREELLLINVKTFDGGKTHLMRHLLMAVSMDTEGSHHL